MKNTVIILLCLVCLPFLSLYAQVVNVCLEEDSVTLAVENYQYGNIQWQQSTDNENWENIEGAIFHTYTCFPENSTYYRAWISYQNCPPDSSQVTFLQRKIQANAGVDKVIHTGFTTELFGNEYDGTFGQWTVLLGDSAQIDNPYAGNTYFYGTDSLYRLCWSLTDACGTTSDTITIEYVTNVYYDKIVFVDTTDIIVSDSAEMANGVFRILFSDSVSISYASILMGLQGDGFLQRVQSCIYIGDTCCMNTVKATLTDILVSGSIHIEDFVSMVYRRGGDFPNAIRLNHRPTRAEILSDSTFRSNKIIYYIEEKSEPHFVRSRNDGLFFNLNSPFFLTAGIQITDFHLACHPNFGYEIKKTWGVPVYINFGSYNGDFDATVNMRLPQASLSIPACDVPIWQHWTPIIVFMGSIPIYFSVNFNLSAHVDGDIDYSAPIDLVLNQHTDYDARITIDHLVPSKHISTRGKLTGDIIESNNPFGSCEVSVNASVIGELSLALYGSIAAYFNIGPKGGWSLCASHDGYGHWANQQGIFVKGVSQVGIRTEGLVDYLFNGDVNYPFEFLQWDMRRPNRIEYVSGNNQIFGGSNQPLPEPIRVKAYTYFNNPSANHYIYFEPENGGTVNSSDYHFVTNSDGIAEAIWSPESSESKLKVSAYDCSGNYISGGPIVISTSGDVCTNSTLTAQTYLDGGLVNLVVSGGVPPFQYSTDGITYEDQYTPFAPEIGTEYTIHVKDAQNCETAATYVRANPYNEIICLDNNNVLSLFNCCLLEDFTINSGDINANWRSIIFYSSQEDEDEVLLLSLDEKAASPSLPQGYYIGITCENLTTPIGLFNFCTDGSIVLSEDNGVLLSSGEFTYSKDNNRDVFNFTFTDANGLSYIGAFNGVMLYYHTTIIGEEIEKKSINPIRLNILEHNKHKNNLRQRN